VKESGLILSDFNSSSDIYIINTCTVTGNADKKSRHAIRQARKRNPKAKIIVTGCYPEVYPEKLNNLDEIDAFVGNEEKKNILKHLQGSEPRSHTSHLTSRTSSRIRANLMIENGCEEFCSYCIVPYARGKVTRKPVDQIVWEAGKLVDQGVKEIVLTGINLGAYGNELTEVLHKLYSFEKLLRIRLSSIEPLFITDELIGCIADLPKVCNHLHIPLQSGDDAILKAMNRRYSKKDFSKLTRKIRKRIPNVSLNTDIIVGFPGESEKAFKNTLKFVERAKFSRIHPFHFSPRPKTPAATMPDQIDPRIIKKRTEKAQSLRIKLMKDYAKRAKRRPQEVLVESRDKKTGLLEGLTESYIRVLFEGNSSLIGKLAKVKITDVSNEFVTGKLL
jgi:threonylcarbamoyladenosine tRNA methylthiotransferase MtaB